MVADTFDWDIFTAPAGTERKSSFPKTVIYQEDDKVCTCKYGHLLSFNRDYIGALVVNRYNELASKENQPSQIAHDHVYRALFAMKQHCSSTDDYFYLFASLNLLNAAIKTPEWKHKLSYRAIKGRVSDFFREYATNPSYFQGIRAHYNSIEKVAYVKIYGVVFSFHYIPIDRTIELFISSNRNTPILWDGVKLQKISDWIYEKASSLSNLSQSDINTYNRWKERRIANEESSQQRAQTSQRTYAA